MLNLTSFSPSNFGRYVSQTESNPEEPMNIDDWTQGSPPTMNDLPSLLAFSAVSGADLPTNNTLKTTSITSSLVTEDVEPLPYLHHGPGPIQRPTKLNYSSIQPIPPLNSMNSVQSSGTPDVLDQINSFLYESSPSTSNNVNASSVTSPMINDLSTQNIPWTFSPSEWSAKIEPSWTLTGLQSPNIPLSSPMQNPFALMSQTSRGDSSLWSSTTVRTGSPRFVSPTIRTQRVLAWNDVFSSTVPSAVATESTKINNNPWDKYMSAPDPSATDVTSHNGHETLATNPFWALSSLSTDSVVPTSPQIAQGSPSRIWWTGLSSDENNNNNHTTDDNSTTRDQSRWDFAR